MKEIILINATTGERINTDCIEENNGLTKNNIIWTKKICDICDLYIVDGKVIKDRMSNFKNTSIGDVDIKEKIVCIENCKQIQIFIPNNRTVEKSYILAHIKMLHDISIRNNKNEEFKIGDKVYINGNSKFKGEIINILSWRFREFNRLDYDYKNGSENENDLALVKIYGADLIHKVSLRKLNKINDHQESEENIKDSIEMEVIGVKRENGYKILWNRIGDLNLEFTIEGKIPMITVIKVLIKNLDLKEFTYERVCPYKIVREYPKHNNVERNHIFSVKWVDFDGNIKSQEIIRTNDSLCLTNCKIKVFIPDLLEVARMKQLVSLKGNTYIAHEDKLNGLCDSFKPIVEINRGMFEKQGWQVPKSFETRFINNKRF